MKKASSGENINFSISREKGWIYYYTRKVKRIFKRLLKINDKVTGKEVHKNGCSYLKENGCELYYHERPIKCVVATCKELKNSLNKYPDKRHKYAYLIDRLFIISLIVFEIQKREVDLSKRYGRLALALTPVLIFCVYFKSINQGQEIFSFLEYMHFY